MVLWAFMVVAVTHFPKIGGCPSFPHFPISLRCTCDAPVCFRVSLIRIPWFVGARHVGQYTSNALKKRGVLVIMVNPKRLIQLGNAALFAP